MTKEQGINNRDNDDRNSVLKERIEAAITKLHLLIDGGEECRGMDSAISEIINTLEGKP